MEVICKRMIFACLILRLFFTGNAAAQKPPLDTGSFKNWPEINGGRISNDGQFIAYKVDDNNGSDLNIAAVNSRWQQVFHGATNLQFSSDSKWCLIDRQAEGVILLSLTNKNVKEISHVSNAKFIDQKGKQWLIYTKASAADSLICLDLDSRKPVVYDHLQSLFEHHGKLYLQFKGIEKRSLYSLVIVDEIGGARKEIWTGPNAIQTITFDGNGGALAFLVNETGASKKINIFYFKPAMQAAIPLPNVSDPKNASLYLDNIRDFSPDGRFLFVTTLDSDSTSSRDFLSKGVDIWSYKDNKLQSQQLIERTQTYHPLVGVYDLNNSYSYTQLQKSTDKYIMFPPKSSKNALAVQSVGDDDESYWRTASKPLYYLLSVQNGQRMALETNGGQPDFSPMGKYLVWYLVKTGKFICYNVQSGVSVPISVPLSSKNFYGEPKLITSANSVNHWFDGDAGLLISDGYDLWKVDPRGLQRPINWTNGYGKKHGVTFYFSAKKGPLDGTLLEAYGQDGKEGYFIRPTNISSNPKKLYFESVHLVDFLKAESSNTYVIKKEQSNSFPNYFISHDLKHLNSVTYLQPQKAYNWYHGSIIQWKTIDGKIAKGALYKPENFDPQKKYPVIFLYYEKLAYYANHFLRPLLSDAVINVPWYVSNGYLVVEPDINYKPGHPGWSAFNTVVSGADYLSTFPWVDAKHIGLQGHSFGGFETNYIISHSNKFACAMSAAGISDLVANAFSIYLGGVSSQSNTEMGQMRIFCTLWQNPNIYLENSPIYRADKITTPLLLMSNKNDRQVPWAQSVGFFSALRRLNKKVWMLQYDEEGHTLDEPKNQMDYSIRVKQFFDYYLKGAPPPIWMTRGVPASLKGIYSALQLDTTGAKP